MRLFCVLAALVTASTANGATLTANFENFTEGEHFAPSFTDPVSGIFFTSSTAANHNFVIEFSNDPRSPIYLNNKYLVGNGLAPGAGFSLASNFGFTAILPSAADKVRLDAGVGDSGTGPCAIVLTGYDAGNQIVAMDSIHGPLGNFTQVAIGIESDRFNIDH